LVVQKSDAGFGYVISAMWANEEAGGVQMHVCVAIIDMARSAQARHNFLPLPSPLSQPSAMPRRTIKINPLCKKRHVGYTTPLGTSR